MKVLAIRGRNLASLADRFELDFSRPPLAEVGLFAVTGPTGAGKSTLLDALCVALYNRTPRLENRGGVVLGIEGSPDADLGAADVRFLLRRGETEGFAEVEFRAHDARVYRTRWEVRRAWGKIDGNLGKPQRHLFRLDDGVPVLVAEGIRDVGEEIPKLVGLDFEQFRRSALLAQGDFAALLKAKPEERADLLERMTGTEIYAQLSKAAFERVRDQRGQIDQRKRAREDLKGRLLTPDARAEREADLERASERASELRGDEAKLVEALRWWGVLAEHDRAIGQGETAVEGARLADAAATERRGWLALVEGAEALRPFVDALDRAQATLTDEREELTRRGTAVETAVAGAKATEGALALALARTEEATTARDAMRPAIVEARALDVKVHSAADEVKAARTDAEIKAGLLQERTEAVKELDRQLTAGELARENSVAWLERQARMEPVVREWTRWVDALRLLIRQRGARDALAKKVGEARTASSVAVEHEAGARRVFEEARSVFIERERALAERQHTADATDGPALQARQSYLVTLRQTLVEGAGLVLDLVTSQETIAGAEREAGEARVSGEQARLEAASLAAKAGEVRAAEDGAQRDLDDARAAMSLVDHRAHLIDGKPCPVCGSQEHPWANAAPVFDDLILRFSDRVASLRSQREGLQAAATKHAAEEQALLRRAVDRDKLAGETRASLAPKLGRWGELSASVRASCPEQLPWPSAPDAAFAESLDGRAREIADELTPIGAALTRLVDEQKGIAKERKALDDARGALEGLRNQAEMAGKQSADAAHELDVQARALAKAEQDVVDAVATVEPLVAGQPDWAKAVNDAPKKWLEDTAQVVDEWSVRRATLEKLHKESERLSTGRTVAIAAVDSAAVEAGAANKLLGTREKALADLQSQRSSLLRGREADSVEGDLETALGNAQSALNDARKAYGDAEGLRREVEARWRESEERAGKATQAVEATRARLAGEIAGRDLTEHEARRRLAPDAEWRSREREALQALADAVREAEARLDERRKQRARHLEQQSPSWPAEDCDARLVDTRAAIGEAATAENDLRLALGMDDETKAQDRRLQAEIAEIEVAAGVWVTLADLIGSHDGKRFKVFAQGLTFEALLAHANRHLVDLAPRYSLRRAPGSDLDLQVVDHDLADEVRPSTGLSGGESFLVSLALALGLSGLAARDTRIESLFIDEGFGTLDADTLEAALSALDALQSAGRTVGIISHVPGLAERLGVKVSVTPEGAGRSSVCVE
jgi:exonuclease SbcC